MTRTGVVYGERGLVTVRSMICVQLHTYRPGLSSGRGRETRSGLSPQHAGGAERENDVALW